MRVVHLGDVAGVGRVLVEALSERVEVHHVAIPQPGSALPRPLKVLALPLRLWAAIWAARELRGLHPDVVHVHWVPNGLAAVLSRRPFIIHAHGDDVRELNLWRGPVFRWIIRRAKFVLYSTPDLGRWVDGEWLPNPVRPLSPMPQELAVFVASRAEASKGRSVALTAASRAQDLSITALAGPDIDPSTSVRTIPELPAAEFHRMLASRAVVWGQFKLGALGLTELEAMSAGTAVICWVSDECVAAYGGRVPVVSTRDPAVIVSETRRLMQDRVAREALNAEAQAFVKEWHDPSAIADRLFAIYAAVVARST